MNDQQTAEVRFRGEKLATHTEGTDVYTLYRTPERLYRVHIDEGEGGLAWLESGHLGNGLTEARIRTVFPELSTATNRLGSMSPQDQNFPLSGDIGV